jgi:hypothetical protein
MNRHRFPRLFKRALRTAVLPRVASGDPERYGNRIRSTAHEQARRLTPGNLSSRSHVTAMPKHVMDLIIKRYPVQCYHGVHALEEARRTASAGGSAGGTGATATTTSSLRS